MTEQDQLIKNKDVIEIPKHISQDGKWHIIDIQTFNHVLTKNEIVELHQKWTGEDWE